LEQDMTRLLLATGIIAATLASGAMAQDCATSGDAKVGVIEILQFRLAAGADRNDFLAAAATMPVLCATEGFIGRTLSEGEDGAWTDHVKWTSPDLAQAAMAGSMENEALLPFIMASDPDSMALTYKTPVDLN
jgi:hypothetical protein